MTSESFRNLSAEHAAKYPLLLQALWHEAAGDWKRAHEVAQDVESPEAAWVHAYLHRREGDDWNATYWYRRAGKPVPNGTLDDEWTTIATALLNGNEAKTSANSRVKP